MIPCDFRDRANTQHHTGCTFTRTTGLIQPIGCMSLTYIKVCADPSVELPVTTRTSTTWNVNLAAGSGIVVNVWDGVNDEYSEPAWIRMSLHLL
jgi:hypothetical protein